MAQPSQQTSAKTAGAKTGAKTEVSKAIAREPFAAEHLYRCPKCGELIDSRDMAAVVKHEKPH
jgi:hypothetical protein